MMEYGSDFHSMDNFFSERFSLTRIYPNSLFLANGRQCLEILIKKYAWKRIWIPAYFCYEVMNSIRNTGIKILLYADYPSAYDVSLIEYIDFQEGDVLFRVNYFGLRNYRSNKNIPVPVIEDHTHDVLGCWALHSDADWCIASLRKTYPIASGGMLWSPKGHVLPFCEYTEDNHHMAEIRWKAMDMKRDYLMGGITKKNEFRKLFVETEELMESLPLSLMDNRALKFVGSWDINAWYNLKRQNWNLLKKRLPLNIHYLIPENESCTPFSLVLLLDNRTERDKFRLKLIENHVYPAVLWSVPEDSMEDISNFSRRMISIHCDGRYNECEMIQLGEIIKACLYDSNNKYIG